MPPTSVTQVQLWPQVVCGLSFSRSQPDSEGFSPGTPVFLPPQNRLPVIYIWLGLRCSEITNGSYGGSHGRLHMHSVRSRWAGWSWKALVGSGQLSAHLHLHLPYWRQHSFTVKLLCLPRTSQFVPEFPRPVSVFSKSWRLANFTGYILHMNLPPTLLSNRGRFPCFHSLI